MIEKDFWWKVSISAVLLAVGIVSVFPFEQNIKLGIDLSGGYSLLYEIDDAGLDAGARAKLSGDVMSILKERVDPNGVLNLVWRPVGANRLEIQMPRPPAEVGEARDAYRAVQDKLIATVVRRGDIAVALSRPEPERTRALDDLVRGVARRQEMFKRLATAYDAMKVAENSTDDAVLEKAEAAYNALFAEVLATNPDLTRLDAAIQSDPGKPFRKKELDEIKKAHGDLVALIDDAVARYDDWRGKRGSKGTLDDPADLQRLLQGAGVLEFRLLPQMDSADPTAYDRYVQQLQKRGPRPQPGDRFGWFTIENAGYFFKSKNIDAEFDAKKRSICIAERYGEKYYVLAHLEPNKALAQDPGAGAWELKSAVPTRDEEGRPAVAFTLDERGGNRFQKLTSENINKMLCFFLDGQAVSAANIHSAIRTQGRITGSFTPQEVQQLCQKLSAGSLPRKLKEPPISVRGIGPSLGEANRAAGTKAAIYGGLAVAVFMIAYYYYSGAVAIFALGLNLLLTMAVVATLNATLNLAGIAGLVLSIGMSIDANVLINERIREELQRGVSMRMAIKLGYERAFSAILDSNVTTILTSAILYAVGSEEIRGFGLTLGWGVLISMLTAVYVTRMFFEYMEATRVPRDAWRSPLLVAVAVAAGGAVLYGLGWALNPPELLKQSVFIYFGKVCGIFLPATLVVLAAMQVIRAIHKSVQSRNPNTLPMLHLIRVPSVDWYGKRKMLYVVSIVTTVIGVAIFAMRDDKDKYDIEFLGGTSAQIDLKPDRKMDEKAIEDRLKEATQEIKQVADKFVSATVTQREGLFAVSVPGVPAERVANVMQVIFAAQIRQGGVVTPPDRPGEVTIAMKDEALIDGAKPTVESVRSRMQPAAERWKRAADEIAEAQVQVVTDVGGGGEKHTSFEIVTRETSRELVVDAIMAKLRDDLDIQQTLAFDLVRNSKLGDAAYFPVTSDDLGQVIGDSKTAEAVPGMMGGVAIVLDHINPPQTTASIDKRLRDMRLSPGHADTGWRQQRVIGLTHAGSAAGATVYSRVAIVVGDETYVFEEGGTGQSTWKEKLAEPEVKLVQEALTRETSLGKVTQFNPQVADEAKMRAFLAMAGSWLMIVIYLWFRFGNASWGLAAVLGLVHDVLVALGFVVGAYLLCGPVLGSVFSALKVQPFRIDMAVVAALLTVIGYSVNDTIVVFDRIRENRGKLTEITPQLVNQSINQTMSRTLLTVFNVLLTIVIMYWWGGQGIRGFSYAMLMGTLTGCYSSIFVASPMLVWLQKRAMRTAA